MENLIEIDFSELLRQSSYTSQSYYSEAFNYLKERAKNSGEKDCATYENILRLAEISAKDFHTSCLLKATDRIANRLTRLAEAIETLKDPEDF